MSSKSKEVRIEQRRILETKLELRLKKLIEKGISKEDAQRDPLVKNLKSQIRETNVRIAAFEKNIKLVQTLAQAKAEKLAAPPKKKEKPKAKPVAKKTAAKEKAPPKPKAAKKQPAAAGAKASKKRAAATADKEPKKKPPAAAGAKAPKKTRAKKEEPKSK